MLHFHLLAKYIVNISAPLYAWVAGISFVIASIHIWYGTFYSSGMASFPSSFMLNCVVRFCAIMIRPHTVSSRSSEAVSFLLVVTLNIFTREMLTWFLLLYTYPQLSPCTTLFFLIFSSLLTHISSVLYGVTYHISVKITLHKGTSCTYSSWPSPSSAFAVMSWWPSHCGWV